MTWRASLRPASFRGVPFYVVNHTLDVGRRVAEHEYPNGEIGFSEDMGKALRRGTLNAFLIGQDYHVARDLLLEALETRGAGTLVHPYLGVFRVTVRVSTLTETTERGGYCEITIPFVETGERDLVQTYSKFAVATAAATARAGVLVTFADTLAKTYVNGPLHVTRAFNLWWRQTVWPQIAAVRGVTSTLENAATLATQHAIAVSIFGEMLSDPNATAVALADLFGLLGTVAALETLALVFDPTSDTSAAGMLGDMQRVSKAMVRGFVYARGAALATEADYASRDDAIAAKTAWYPRLRDEFIRTGDSAFADMATAVADTLGALADTLPRERDHAVTAVTSTLELANSLYSDVAREGEFAQRNMIIHPGFVTGTLRILS